MKQKIGHGHGEGLSKHGYIVFITFCCTSVKPNNANMSNTTYIITYVWDL